MTIHSPHATYALGQERCTGVSDPEEHQCCLAAALAVARYTKNSRLGWREWITVTGPALVICRQTARLRARDAGGRYEGHMNQLLAFYQLDNLDKSNRSALLSIMDRLREVEAWRELQPNKDDFNNPQTVWQGYQKSSNAHDAKNKNNLSDIELLHNRIAELEAENEDLLWENAGLKRGRKGLGASGEHEWYTPPEIVALVREVFRGTIDLDPASSPIAQRVVQARHYHTKEDNGLTKKWFGNDYLNGPFGDLFPWVQKLLLEIEVGHVRSAIMLTHDNIGTKWFQLALNGAQSVCCHTGNMRFLDERGMLTKQKSAWATAFFYFGPDVERFEQVFSPIGKCARPSRRHGG